MAAKDADLIRDFEPGFLALSNEVVAEFEVEVGTTPDNESVSSRVEELFLVDELISEFTVELGPTPSNSAPPPTDTTPPEVTNFSPAGTTAIESDQIIEFDITDSVSLATVILFASFPSGIVEMVHDNTGFRGNYVGDVNSRTVIAGGWHYMIRRVGGWEETPSLEFIPVDSSGNIGVIT